MRTVDKKYIIELTNINVEYQEDLAERLEDFLYNTYVATDVKITDVTEDSANE